MTKTEIAGIAPFFIVKNVPIAMSFYRDHLGFDIVYGDDGLRGFEVKDADGYLLFFGRTRDA